jgi:hypothetical protein
MFATMKTRQVVSSYPVSGLSLTPIAAKGVVFVLGPELLFLSFQRYSSDVSDHGYEFWHLMSTVAFLFIVCGSSYLIAH